VSAFSGFETALCLDTTIPLLSKYPKVLFPEEITPTYQYVARTDGCQLHTSYAAAREASPASLARLA
jgi:hypothetical protein